MKKVGSSDGRYSNQRASRYPKSGKNGNGRTNKHKPITARRGGEKNSEGNLEHKNHIKTLTPLGA